MAFHLTFHNKIQIEVKFWWQTDMLPKKFGKILQNPRQTFCYNENHVCSKKIWENFGISRDLCVVAVYIAKGMLEFWWHLNLQNQAFPAILSSTSSLC